MSIEEVVRVLGGSLVVMAPVSILISAWVRKRQEKAQIARMAAVDALHADIAETTQTQGTAAAHRLVQLAYKGQLDALDAVQQAQAASLGDDPVALAKFVQDVIDGKAAQA